MEDSERNIGVRLTKELFAVAGEALKINVTTLGPLVLPLSEQLLFFFNLVARKVRVPGISVTHQPANSGLGLGA